MEKFNGIKIVGITNEAYGYYRTQVNGNYYTNLDLAQRKLTRNIILAKYLGENVHKNKMYKYGQLYIELDEGSNTVVGLQNFKGVDAEQDKDLEQYERLNEILGITEIEEQMKIERREKLAAVSHLEVSMEAVRKFQSQYPYSRTMTDEYVKNKLRSRVAFGRKLKQTEVQKEKGIQFYKYGKMLIAVCNESKIEFIKFTSVIGNGEKESA